MTVYPAHIDVACHLFALIARGVFHQLRGEFREKILTFVRHHSRQVK